MSSILAVPGLEKTSPAFRQKLVAVAGRLGLNPDWLATAMSFESNRTFSPSVKNPYTNATGLIQFMPATAKSLGTTVAALSAMTAEQQLDYVEKYFRPHAGKLKSLEDTYLAIFYPALIGKPLDTQSFLKGNAVYEQNRGFDQNKDGVITPREITAVIRSVAAKAGGNRLPVDAATVAGGFGGGVLGGMAGGALGLILGPMGAVVGAAAGTTIGSAIARRLGR